MPRLAWRHICLSLALMVLAGLGWVRHAGSTPSGAPLEDVAAYEPVGLSHDVGDPALPQAPTSDGEPSESELDNDLPERMAPVAGAASIPPPGCAGRLGIRAEHVRGQLPSVALYRPPRA